MHFKPQHFKMSASMSKIVFWDSTSISTILLKHILYNNSFLSFSVMSPPQVGGLFELLWFYDNDDCWELSPTSLCIYSLENRAGLVSYIIFNTMRTQSGLFFVLPEIQYLPSSHPFWSDPEWVRRVPRCDACGQKEPVQWQLPEWHHVREVWLKNIWIT